jgi:methionyl-tRNA formyltransferase
VVDAVALCGESWGYEAAVLAGVPFAPVFPAPNARRVFFLNWQTRVPDEVLFRYECINFHCTDLRQSFGRGGNPIENLILRGYAETVISAHAMTGVFDAGPVYGVSEPISLSGTKDDITARFVEPVAKMMRWIIETNPEPKPQVGAPVYFRRLPPDVYAEFWAKRAHG